MAAKVVDASALAAVLFDEPGADSIAARLANSYLYAPSLLKYELANVCFVKSRRHPEQHRVLLEAFRHRQDFDLEYVEVDLDGVLRLAIETGLTAYDASYLWLARHLPAELVTLDRQLLRALSP